MSINIRQETPEDIERIHAVTVSAFLTAKRSNYTEQFIVKELRKLNALTLSLVAEDEGQIVGHVAVSPVTISDATNDWYGLGPISVDPMVQGKGIGSQLMYAALSALKEIKASGCVLLGDPNYYGRFGFEPIKGLIYPGSLPANFQAISLNGSSAQGEVSYHEGFFATE